MQRLKLKRFDRLNFFCGLALIGVGILMPLFLTVDNLHIWTDLMMGIRRHDSIPMLIAALKLVFLNILRGLPHYLGAFLMAESVIFTLDDRDMNLVKALLVLGGIAGVYELINALFHVRYDFGVPALVLVCMIFLFSHADYHLVSSAKKLIMVALFLCSVQFLDIMPALAPLPVGRGEMSWEIKNVARFLEAESVLQSAAVLFCCLFALMGLVVLMLVRDENNLRAVNELKKQNEQILMDARIKEMENRTFLEMRHLVHDLKSPLTSAQALISLAHVSLSEHQDDSNAALLDKAEHSIDRMSSMISEILNENHRTCLTTKELMDATLSQISVSDCAALVTLQNLAPEQYVSVNKIRFVRALVNLIENAFFAVDKASGQIQLTVRREADDALPVILFTVRDNGCGIDPAVLSSIWESGFSTRNSHGLGLSFVHKVVCDSDGAITVASTPIGGTVFSIVLPESDAF